VATNERPPLTRERILQAALELVDREGLEAVSMRRLGAALGVEAMSLYNRVAGKAEVLDGVYELVLAALPPLRRRGDWRAVLRERGRALRAALCAHPKAIPLFATRPAVTPASLRYVEETLGVLRAAGFSPGAALVALQVLVAFVVGHTLDSYGAVDPDAASAPDYERLDPRAFPRVREMARRLGRRDLEREFRAGLDAMLAGLGKRRGGRR